MNQKMIVAVLLPLVAVVVMLFIFNQGYVRLQDLEDRTELLDRQIEVSQRYQLRESGEQFVKKNGEIDWEAILSCGGGMGFVFFPHNIRHEFALKLFMSSLSEDQVKKMLIDLDKADLGEAQRGVLDFKILNALLPEHAQLLAEHYSERRGRSGARRVMQIFHQWCLFDRQAAITWLDERVSMKLLEPRVLDESSQLRFRLEYATLVTSPKKIVSVLESRLDEIPVALRQNLLESVEWDIDASQAKGFAALLVEYSSERQLNASLARVVSRHELNHASALEMVDSLSLEGKARDAVISTSISNLLKQAESTKDIEYAVELLERYELPYNHSLIERSRIKLLEKEAVK